MRHALPCASALLLLACRPSGPGTCTLPALASSDTPTDNALVLDLPANDSAFVVNGTRLVLAQLDTAITETFSLRAQDQKMLFVRPVPAARCSDLSRVIALVRKRGGRTFDAKASGFPDPPVDFVPTQSDEQAP